MYKVNFSVYLGEESESDFLGFTAENNLFLAIDTVGFDKEKGREFLKEISSEIIHKSINSLVLFDEYLTAKINLANLPVNFSLAAGYLVNNKLYLKTMNEGEVYIKRDKQMVKILDGGQTASGFIQENDLYIFSTKEFNETLKGAEKIKKYPSHKKPHEIIEELTPEIKAMQDNKAIALLVSLQEDRGDEINKNDYSGQEEKVIVPASGKISLFAKIKNDFLRLNNLPENYRKKRITLVFVVVIFLVLVWSVVFGYQRRLEAGQQKKIAVTKEAVAQKLRQADDEAFLDLPKALVLISEAKNDVNTVEKNTSKKYQKDIDEIKQMISSEESKLLKKEEKNYEEYYDLAIESKDIEGTRLYLDANILAVLDNKKGIVYNLALDKKSLEKKNSSDFKVAKNLAEYDGDIFSYIPKEGIIKLAGDKSKKIIEYDKDWSEIVDLQVYNGNLYLLDKGKDEIYKYLVAENGYSSKQSYFTAGSAIDLSDASSMAIDSAVYISFSNYVAKYISGVRDEFKTNFPDDNLSFTKVFTTKELEKVYIWDKNHAVIYVLSKNGNYERQIKSSIIAKAIDFVVYENSAYFLVGQKIYKINLD